jgi:hypothetical protein
LAIDLALGPECECRGTGAGCQAQLLKMILSPEMRPLNGALMKPRLVLTELPLYECAKEVPV